MPQGNLLANGLTEEQLRQLRDSFVYRVPNTPEKPTPIPNHNVDTPLNRQDLSPEFSVPGGLKGILPDYGGSLAPLQKATSIGPTIRSPQNTLKSATSIAPMTPDNTSRLPFPRDMGQEGPRNLSDVVGRVEDLSNLTGLNPTDTGNIEGPSEAVTRFVTKGVPDKAARIASTNKYLQSARKFPTVAPAAEAFAKKYPRIAAHTRIPEELGKDPNSYAAMQPYEPGVTEGLIEKYHVPINIHYTRHGVRTSPNQGLNTTFHEGTHVAQKLGLGEAANDLYQNMFDLYGYKWHPMEIGAVRSGQRNMNPPQSAFGVKLDESKLANTQDNIAKFLDSGGYQTTRTMETMLKTDLAGKMPPHLLAGRDPALSPEAAKSLAEQTLRILENRKFGGLRVGQRIVFEDPTGHIQGEMANKISKNDLPILRQAQNSGMITIKSLK